MNAIVCKLKKEKIGHSKARQQKPSLECQAAHSVNMLVLKNYNKYFKIHFACHVTQINEIFCSRQWAP